jgi:hypothetical protein
LDDQQQHAITSHLHGVHVTKLTGALHGSTAGRACSAPTVRSQLARFARQAGVR